MILILSPGEADKVQKALSRVKDPEIAAVCERLAVVIALDTINKRLDILARLKGKGP